MDGWGNKLLGAARLVAAAAAVGFGLPAGALTRLMDGGPHLLAPTGSDLSRHGRRGGVLAGFHYDLNLLTIHGRSRFPGLHVWLRDGTRVAVRVPPGCLLLQAGKQLEHLTAGHVRAGWHEVVVTEATERAAAEAAAAGRPTWRVSSTVFAHVASAAELRPLGRFAEAAAAVAGGSGGDGGAEYPPMPAGEQVRRELEVIKLAAASSASAASAGGGVGGGGNGGPPAGASPAAVRVS